MQSRALLLCLVQLRRLLKDAPELETLVTADGCQCLSIRTQRRVQNTAVMSTRHLGHLLAGWMRPHAQRTSVRLGCADTMSRHKLAVVWRPLQ